MTASRNKKGRSALLLLPAAGAAVFSAGVRELYRYSFTRSGSPLVSRLKGERKTHEEAYYTWRDSRKETLKAAPQIRMSIVSNRGERLAGFYLPCENSDGSRIAFVVHGYGSEHAETAGMVLDYWHSRGFDVFAPDNTAHGESDGEIIGFDLFESADALKWIGYLKARTDKPLQIVLHGFSLGGASVMKMSDQVGPEVKFIVEDSGYTEAESLLKASPLFRTLKLLHRALTGSDLADTDVRPNLSRASVPILFVQGTDDPTVPSENAPALYEFYQGPKEKLILPDTKHIEGMYTSPEEYAAKLDEMIGRYVSSRT